MQPHISGLNSILIPAPKKKKKLRKGSILTHILSSCNTGRSRTGIPNPDRSLWPVSSADHWGNKSEHITYLIMEVITDS